MSLLPFTWGWSVIFSLSGTSSGLVQLCFSTQKRWLSVELILQAFSKEGREPTLSEVSPYGWRLVLYLLKVSCLLYGFIMGLEWPHMLR